MTQLITLSEDSTPTAFALLTKFNSTITKRKGTRPEELTGWKKVMVPNHTFSI